MILLIFLHHGINALHVLGDAELPLGASIVHEADLPEDVPLRPALRSKDVHLFLGESALHELLNGGG